MFEIQNNSDIDITDITDIISQFMPFSQERLEFDKPVSLIFQSDDDNANKLLGKTAAYSPEEFSITVFIDGRHPKDILRSLSHELVHHAQNCRGDFDQADDCGPGYAQQNPHLRNMEIEAYKRGNMIFRDFEDLIKAGDISIEFSGEPTMSLKEWRDNELNKLLMEKWNFGTRKEGVQYRANDGSEKGSEKDPADYTGTHKEEDEAIEDVESGKGLEESLTVAEAKELAERIFTKLGVKQPQRLREKHGEEEGEHYRKNVGADEVHLAAIRHHLDALEHDKDYDEQREDLEEATIREVATKVLKRLMGEAEMVKAKPAPTKEKLKKAVEMKKKGRPTAATTLDKPAPGKDYEQRAAAGVKAKEFLSNVGDAVTGITGPSSWQQPDDDDGDAVAQGDKLREIGDRRGRGRQHGGQDASPMHQSGGRPAFGTDRRQEHELPLATAEDDDSSADDDDWEE